jgi:hypothetical protein
MNTGAALAGGVDPGLIIEQPEPPASIRAIRRHAACCIIRKPYPALRPARFRDVRYETNQ